MLSPSLLALTLMRDELRRTSRMLAEIVDKHGATLLANRSVTHAIGLLRVEYSDALTLLDAEILRENDLRLSPHQTISTPELKIR